MKKIDDSVFQVSLTEIAFTLVLLLALLLSCLVWRAENDNERLRGELQHYETYGGMCQPQPDDALEPMMPCARCVAQVAQMDSQEAKDSIELGKSLYQQWKAHHSPQVSMQTFNQRLQQAAREIALGKTMVSDSSVRTLQKQLSSATKENTQARAQVEKYKVLCKRAGLDRPPCWSTARGKPEFLFNIQLNNNNTVSVSPGWPGTRDADARRLPHVLKLIEMKTVPMDEFLRSAQDIAALGDNEKPDACRHFVRLRNLIKDGAKRDAGRLNIEEFFYKLEVQRFRQ